MASAFLESDSRTNIYVDGFNLYYGALRKTPYRWVNLESLFQFLLPKNTIQEIKYFTPLVSARPNDPSQPQRQQLYLRVLATLPKVSVHLGHFLVHEVTMPLVVAPGQPQQYARVIKTEKKGSDVNLATHLLHDAHMDRFDVAVVVSNDSDLLGRITISRHHARRDGTVYEACGLVSHSPACWSANLQSSSPVTIRPQGLLAALESEFDPSRLPTKNPQVYSTLPTCHQEPSTALTFRW